MHGQLGSGWLSDVWWKVRGWWESMGRGVSIYTRGIPDGCSLLEIGSRLDEIGLY
jgi:hypothetical protein